MFFLIENDFLIRSITNLFRNPLYILVIILVIKQ